MKVAILGASPKTHRYSYKAMNMLKEHGHQCFLVSPIYEQIEEVETYKSLQELSQIHTLTMYVGENISNGLEQDIIALSPKRVIFNPGSENNSLAKLLKSSGIEVVEGCTLVMLSTDQFE